MFFVIFNCFFPSWEEGNVIMQALDLESGKHAILY